MRIPRLASILAGLATVAQPLPVSADTLEEEPLLERPMTLTPARSTVAVGLAVGLILASKEAARLQPSRGARLRARREA